MFIDAQLQFSNGQALSATAASTNVIDLGPITPNTQRRIGAGEPMAIMLNVSTAADFTTGDETYSVTLQTDDADSFGSAATVAQWTIPASQLTAGATIGLGVPKGVPVERYIRLNYTLGGTSPSVTLSAYLQPQSMVQAYYAYADNSTIT